jgi:energy-coupling factor transporter ATP-binding protein EcfA2
MTTPAPPAIAATGLRKSFGDHVVLDGIDLTVAPGTIFALLGPNGAGKTATVQILSTLIGANAGEARVAGHDVAREPDGVRAAIGVHINLRFADPAGLRSAVRVLGGPPADDELTLQVPSDGSVRSLRALLDQLDGSSIGVESLSVHLPDLDDVFLALTGQPTEEKVTVR